MERAAARARTMNRAEQDFVTSERSSLDRLGDSHHVLVNHAPRADREMANLGVAHHAWRQADRFARGVDLGMSLGAVQPIHRGSTRHRDRVGLALGPQTPSIEDHQCRNRRPARRTAHRALPPRRNAAAPGHDARAPSSSAMRSRRLYLAVRSPRLIEPVLICPAPVATARSAMVVSSVSPERWETTKVKPAARAISMVSSVSLSVPIWLSLIRI